MEEIEPVNLTKKQKIAHAYRMGYQDGYKIGRTRRDWRTLTLGLGLGILLGMAGAMWLRVVVFS